MSETAAPASLLQYRAFVMLWFMRLSSTIAYHMMVVVIGWTIYALTGDALDLGLVGLVQFVPTVVLTLLIGHLADRYDKRIILRLTQGGYALSAVILLIAFWQQMLSRELLLTIVFILGCARAFEIPTGHSFVPALVPIDVLPRATAAWAASNQAATIAGPALGGFAYSLNPFVACAICVVFFAASCTLTFLFRTRRPVVAREPPTLSSVFAGLHYIYTRPRLLGVISLDLFVVLLGGATALLPVFARDILATGPLGLGLLRSAPAVGALLTMTWLTRHPVERRIGPILFAAVSVFGVATIVFALSTSFVLSLGALAVLGAADAISVVLRFTLVQIETPDAMRGRVSAINSLFTGTSNTLGEFESGAVAAWLGAVPSVLIGGVGSIVIALTWMGLFPALRKVDRFEIPKG